MSTRKSWGAIRRLPSKRYQASFMGPDKVRHLAPDTFKTKTEASEWLAQIRSDIRDGFWEPRNLVAEPLIVAEPLNETPRFKDYALRHIALQTNRHGELLRESTKSMYRRVLMGHLVEFHELTLDAISKPKIQEWYANLVGTGKRTTASKAYKVLSATLRRAEDDGHIKANPCTIRGAHSAVTGKTVDIPTADEVVLIANTIDVRFKNFVMLAAYGGFRYSELTELRRKDVQTVEKDGGVSYVLQVRRAVTLVENKFVVAKPKSEKSVRDVSIAPALTPLINGHLFDNVPDDPEALLFPADDGGHLPHYIFIKAWNRALKKAGVTRAGITPHSLRHFAGTHYHLAGATLPELMTWLGDSSIDAVQRYLHVTDRAPSIAGRMTISPEYEHKVVSLSETFNES